MDICRNIAGTFLLRKSVKKKTSCHSGVIIMAEIRPFAALRPVPELVSQIAELPYDVMKAPRKHGIS